MNPEVELTVLGELLPPEEVLTGDELYYTVSWSLRSPVGQSSLTLLEERSGKTEIFCVFELKR